MGADDAVANAQPQTGTLGGLLGGEKRIEDPLGVGDTCAVVGKGDFDEITFAPRTDGDASALTGLLNGVVSIVKDVQEDLLQLLSVAQRRR